MGKAVDILVIDDEQVVREGVSRVCEVAGLTVDAAADAANGLECLRKGHYRLVLCDIMLPDRDGFQILKETREAGISTPVIMITGCSTLQNAVQALKDGAVDFIPKPFTVDELDSGIQRGLRLQQILEGKEGADRGRACPKGFFRLGDLSWVQIEPNGVGAIGVTDCFMRTV
ncbi:MAG TPA: response regulator, partial [Bacteroidota bacterium]|nr:response regulator [Bacteroidota bacterium]